MHASIYSSSFVGLGLRGSELLESESDGLLVSCWSNSGKRSERHIKIVCIGKKETIVCFVVRPGSIY